MQHLDHVLIVDDDPELSRLLGEYLQRHGNRTSRAPSGRDMWPLLDGRDIDLVILDLMLPGEDGLSLCRRLRTHSDQLLELTHGREAGPFDRSIDVQVGRLRRRLDDDARAPELIKTVRNAGYVLAAAVTRENG